MESDFFHYRLHYAAAVACGLFTAIIIYIICTAFGLDLNQILPGAEAKSNEQFVSALVWWVIAGAGFVPAWAAQTYLIAAAREREIIYHRAQQFLVILVFAATAVAGLLSKSGSIGGTANVIGGFVALSLGFVCAHCGAQLAYLKATQT